MTSTAVIISPSTHGEEARIDALHRLKILDTPPEEAFDRMTRIVAELFKLPIAAVSLTDSDRQWFKSRIGVDHDTIPRFRAPCGQVCDASKTLAIEDLLDDVIYKESHLAMSGIRFYAGAPLMTHDGFCLGALCVLGQSPRKVTPSELAALCDIAAMVMAQIELQHAMGRFDPVSGLPNRTRFIEDFRDLGMEREQGERRFAALVSLASSEQLDNALRSIGPSYLDQLVSSAVRLLSKSRIAGRIYHIAAAEFVFIASEGTGEIEFCALLDNWLRRHAASAASRFVTTARIGVLPFGVGSTHYEDLLRDLHAAVQHGLEQDLSVSVYSAEQAAVYRRRFWLIKELASALDSVAHGRAAQLRLVYQPKIDVASGACVGAEALLRWTHPEAGEIPPGEFIPLIEKTDSIRAVTKWVLEAAMQQLACWHRQGRNLQLAVNISAAI